MCEPEPVEWWASTVCRIKSLEAGEKRVRSMPIAGRETAESCVRELTNAQKNKLKRYDTPELMVPLDSHQKWADGKTGTARSPGAWHRVGG